MPTIIPNGPESVTANSVPSQSAQSARERAIAKMTEAPVQNPNQVSPEEMTAVQPPKAVEAPSEPAPEATPEQTKEETPLSTQYAILARKEKALRLKVQELKAKEEALKSQENAYKAKEQEYLNKYIPKDRLTQDPLSVLNEAGLTYDQLTQLLLARETQPQQTQSMPQNDPLVKKLEEEIKAIRQAQEDAQKKYVEDQNRAYQEALANMKRETEMLVKDSSDYELVRELGHTQDVVDLIEKTFKDEGILLSVEQAAREVEDYLVEEALKINRLKKVQSRLTPPTAAPKQEVSQQQQQTVKPNEQPTIKTLTNSVSTVGKLSARERAILAFKGELNKR